MVLNYCEVYRNELVFWWKGEWFFEENKNIIVENWCDLKKVILVMGCEKKCEIMMFILRLKS